MSMDLEAFSNLVDRLAELNGLDEALAARYAAAIGDTPEVDADGLVVVRDRETLEVVARVRLR